MLLLSLIPACMIYSWSLLLSISHVVYLLKLKFFYILKEYFLWIQFEAAAVNLVAGDKPADVYSEIAARYVQSLQSKYNLVITGCS